MHVSTIAHFSSCDWQILDLYECVDKDAIWTNIVCTSKLQDIQFFELLFRNQSLCSCW